MPNPKLPGGQPAPRRPDPEDPRRDVRRGPDDDLAAAGRDGDDINADDETFEDEEDDETFEDEEDLDEQE